MLYRINFGNGQVHGEWTSRREAEAEMARTGDGHSFIQFCDPETGEWFQAK